MSPWIIYAHFNETGARNIAMIQHKLERKELFTDSAGNDRYFWNEEISMAHAHAENTLKF